jgi:hypothetical protein
VEKNCMVAAGIEPLTMSTRSANPTGKRCPRVDFEMVHVWTMRKMEICETNFKYPRTWTSPTSTCEHCQGP